MFTTLVVLFYSWLLWLDLVGVPKGMHLQGTFSRGGDRAVTHKELVPGRTVAVAGVKWVGWKHH